MRLEWVRNAIAWGPVLGRNKEHPDLVHCGDEHFQHSRPGMLVHCYDGGLELMREKGLDRPGLGIVIAVIRREKPLNDDNAMCLVLWNW